MESLFNLVHNNNTIRVYLLKFFCENLLCLSAALFKGRTATSFTTSINLLFGFSQASSNSASFYQHDHCLFSHCVPSISLAFISKTSNTSSDVFIPEPMYLVTPKGNRNIFSSATSCHFFRTSVSISGVATPFLLVFQHTLLCHVLTGWTLNHRLLQLSFHVSWHFFTRHIWNLSSHVLTSLFTSFPHCYSELLTLST